MTLGSFVRASSVVAVLAGACLTVRLSADSSVRTSIAATSTTATPAAAGALACGPWLASGITLRTAPRFGFHGLGAGGITARGIVARALVARRLGSRWFGALWRIAAIVARRCLPR